MSAIRVGIINVTGYAGVELARLLHQHPLVELTSVTGRSAAGQSLGSIFPHLSAIDLNIEADLKKIIYLKKKPIYLTNKKNIVGLDIKAELPKNPHIKIVNPLNKPLDNLAKELLLKIKKLVIT